MPNYGESQSEKHEGTASQKRWQRLLALPPDTWLKDISSGKRYQVADLEPRFNDQYETSVYQFKCNRTGEYVCVSTLRHLYDGFKCSIGGSSR